MNNNSENGIDDIEYWLNHPDIVVKYRDYMDKVDRVLFRIKNKKLEIFLLDIWHTPSNDDRWKVLADDWEDWYKQETLFSTKKECLANCLQKVCAEISALNSIKNELEKEFKSC